MHIFPNPVTFGELANFGTIAKFKSCQYFLHKWHNICLSQTTFMYRGLLIMKLISIHLCVKLFVIPYQQMLFVS